MRAFSALVLLLAALQAGCGGDGASPESVVRAWSQAVSSDDNAAAAKLFAPNARVIQGDAIRRLRTFGDARAWNAHLPCSGRIVSLRADGETVRATFILGDRRRSKCSGPGERAQALVRVRDGKIVLWHELQAPFAPEDESV